MNIRWIRTGSKPTQKNIVSQFRQFSMNIKIKLIILTKALLARAFSPYGLTKLEFKFFYFAMHLQFPHAFPLPPLPPLPLLPCLLPPLPALARLHSEVEGDDEDAMLHDVMRPGIGFPPLTHQPLTVVFDMV